MNKSLPEISTERATSGKLTERVRGSGMVTSNQSYDVTVDGNKTVDTIMVKVGKEVQKGDTIRITEHRDRYRFRYITTTDTIIRVDSVAVPYPVEVEKIEYRTRGIVQLMAWLGLGALIGFVIWLVLKLKTW